MAPKLSIELVPETCWFSNVRSEVTKAQWDKIKAEVSGAAWALCEICGGQGKKWPVECHEVWEYDDTKHIQTLVRMIALCPSCHEVKHIGLAELRGRLNQATKHLMKVNGWKKKEALQYITEAFDLWNFRSQHEWELDISHLKKYGIDTLEEWDIKLIERKK